MNLADKLKNLHKEDWWNELEDELRMVLTETFSKNPTNEVHIRFYEYMTPRESNYMSSLYTDSAYMEIKKSLYSRVVDFLKAEGFRLSTNSWISATNLVVTLY